MQLHIFSAMARTQYTQDLTSACMVQSCCLFLLSLRLRPLYIAFRGSSTRMPYRHHLRMFSLSTAQQARHISCFSIHLSLALSCQRVVSAYKARGRKRLTMSIHFLVHGMTLPLSLVPTTMFPRFRPQYVARRYAHKCELREYHECPRLCSSRHSSFVTFSCPRGW
jgi:hypothetical protein